MLLLCAHILLLSLQGVKVYSFADFEQIGVDNPAEPSPPKAQDAACIMYTSGTTGDQLHPLLLSFPLQLCACLTCRYDQWQHLWQHLLLPSQDQLRPCSLAHLLLSGP